MLQVRAGSQMERGLSQRTANITVWETQGLQLLGQADPDAGI